LYDKIKIHAVQMQGGYQGLVCEKHEKHE